MTRLEFYTFESEVLVCVADGPPERFTELRRDLVRMMLEVLELSYTEAYAALNKEYAESSLNLPFKQFRMVSRFCKCNFGNIDNIPDVDADGRFNFERPPCPRRGDCKLENIVCNPQFTTHISPSAMKAMELLYNGYGRLEAANLLNISLHTVKNHIRAAYFAVGVHSQAEFIDYAHRNKLFRPK